MHVDLHQQPIFWQYAMDELYLRIGGLLTPVPAALVEYLIRCDRPLSMDPGRDLLDCERDLRARALGLMPRLQDAARRIVVARSGAKNPGSRRVRRARGALRAAVAEHAAVVSDVERLWSANLLVRRWVTCLAGLDRDEGLLGRARRGWLFSSRRPDFVVVFPSETLFVSVRRQRSIPASWGGRVIAARAYGEQWRRDCDENPNESDMDNAGPWTVGYIPATREVFAHRRWCPYLPEEIWLIASGVEPAIGDLLRLLQHRMRSPNSLLLLAYTVHHYATVVPYPATRPNFTVH